MKTAIITSTKVKPRLRHMYGIYDLAAKSQCATQTWSVGVLERRKSDRRVLRRASPYQNTDVQANVRHPPSFHSSSRQRAGGTQARMPVRPAGFTLLKGNRLQACL